MKVVRLILVVNRFLGAGRAMSIDVMAFELCQQPLSAGDIASTMTIAIDANGNLDLAGTDIRFG